MSVKITELPILDSLADNDIVAGVDVSGNVTSKIEMSTLKNYIDTNTQYTAGTNIDITNNVISAPDVPTKEEFDSLSTIFNAFPTESDEDESMTLDGTAEVKFKKFDLKGNTSQGNTDKKNKITFMNMPTTTGAGLSITPNNSELMLSGTAGGSFPVFNATDLKVSIPAGTYTFSLRIKSGTKSGFGSGRDLAIYLRNGTTTTLATITIVNLQNNNNVYSQTFTISESANLYLYAYVNSNQVSLSNLVLQAQLESGSTMTDYAEYSIPTPTTPISVNVVSGDNKIKVCDKNWADVKDATITGTNYSYNANNGHVKIVSNATNVCFDLIGGKRHGEWAPGMSNALDYHITPDNQKTYVISFQNRILTLASGTANQQMNVFTNKRMLTMGWRSDNTVTGETSVTLSKGEYIKSAYIWVNGSDNITNMEFDFQIELDNQTIFEPYIGNTYNIDLRTSKNLFNKDTIINGKVLGPNGALNDSDGYIVGDYIQVKPSTQYTISFDYTTKEYLRVGYYQKNKAFIERPYSGDRPWTITTPSNCYYIRICTPDNYTNVQCEEGNQQTTYEAYSSIELCKIGNYQDYIYKDSDKWYLHKEIGKNIYTGASGEAWTYYQGIVFIDDTNIRDLGLSTNLNIFSNYFEAGIAKMYIAHTTHQRLHINLNVFGLTDITNVTQWKTWLSTHNLEVYFIQNLTNTEITYQPLIDQLNELEKAISYDSQTNISQVNNDLGFIIYAEAIKSLENVLDRLSLLE